MKRRLLTLAALPLVLLVLAGPAGASCDPGYDRQWGLVQVGAPAAWSKSTGAGIKIGIVDSGVDLRHEDLANKVVAGGKCDGTSGSAAQCTNNKADSQDDFGHGTHVGGIAAAYKDNGIGIAGVAPDAQLVVAKALYPTTDPITHQPSASGSIDDINAGIKWVVDHGARVVNLSIGSDISPVTGVFGDRSLDDGINYAWSHGAVSVLASGNQNLFGTGSSNYGNTKAIVVGATGPEGNHAGYSSPVGDAQWAVSAPGGDASPDCAHQKERCVFSTYWQSGSTGNVYGYLQGTSMATPFVAGAVADLLARGMSAQATIDQIRATVDAIPGCGKTTCGDGRLNLARALGATATAPSSCPGNTNTTRPLGGTNGGTTKTTTKRSNGTGTTAGTHSATTAIGGETTSSSIVPDETTVQGDDLRVAQAPKRSGRHDPKDDPSSALKVAGILAVLGAGSTVAPFAWRRFFRRPG